MKKVIFVLLFATVSVISCKEKIPSNIHSALYSYESEVKFNKRKDSLVLSLNKESIDNLSLDSIGTILFMDAYASDKYDEVEKELNEILKYNPKYSDYDEVKNKTLPYRYTDLTKYYNNIGYMNEVQFYKHSIQYDKNTEKPQYGR